MLVTKMEEERRTGLERKRKKAIIERVTPLQGLWLEPGTAERGGGTAKKKGKGVPLPK